MLRCFACLSLLLTAACGGNVDVEPSPSVDTSATTPHTDADASSQASSPTAEDPARTACQACRGDWGRHGLSTKEDCNCRTADPGAPCTDSVECNGQCLADAPREIV